MTLLRIRPGRSERRVGAAADRRAGCRGTPPATTAPRTGSWPGWGYPAGEFTPPDGAMPIGLLDGRPVTGGAFRRFGVVDGMKTAELKRI